MAGDANVVSAVVGGRTILLTTGASASSISAFHKAGRSATLVPRTIGPNRTKVVGARKLPTRHAAIFIATRQLWSAWVAGPSVAARARRLAFRNVVSPAMKRRGVVPRKVFASRRKCEASK